MGRDAERARRGARIAVEKAKRNRDAARRKLLGQRRKLEAQRERNRRRTEGDREDPSRNPSTHSTVPPSDSTAEAAARSPHSTVPRRPRYSDVEPRARLYGLGLYRAVKGTGGDPDE